jgi:hypothetical protein
MAHPIETVGNSQFGVQTTDIDYRVQSIDRSSVWAKEERDEDENV